MPFRHVAYSNTLVARSGVFAHVALPTLRARWARYASCKADARCRPSLCAPRHIDDPRWVHSGLASQYARWTRAAQWHVPTAPPLATGLPCDEPRDETRDAASAGVAGGHGAGDGDAHADGRSRIIDGWLSVRRECLAERDARGHGHGRGGTQAPSNDALLVGACARSRCTGRHAPMPKSGPCPNWAHAQIGPVPRSVAASGSLATSTSPPPTSHGPLHTSHAPPTHRPRTSHAPPTHCPRTSPRPA